MSEKKFCVDCKHCMQDKLLSMWQKFTGNIARKESLCARTRWESTNLITGVVTIHYAACHSERSFLAASKSCGEEGKYWESKND